MPRKQAMRFILLLGVVSLLADITYEGARSITGPYLGLLGASAVVTFSVCAQLASIPLLLLIGTKK